MEHQYEAGLCPMCGIGKLAVNHFRTWQGVHTESGTSAQFTCQKCKARFDCRTNYYAVRLAQGYIDARAEYDIARFRETIGGFQFAD